MKDNQFELKVGDELYQTIHNDIKGLVKIAKVTPTTAKTKNGTSFDKIQYKGSLFCSKGSGSFNMVWYEIRTKELDQKYYLKKLLIKVKNINFSELNQNQLTRIFHISKE